MLSWLLGIFKGSDGQMDWPRIGAVIAALASGGWAVYTFFAARKMDNEKNGGDTTATQTGQGAASGRDTNIGVQNFAAPSPELVAQIQKPLAEELAAQRAQNEKLTNMLLERNPAATPGAQQAVGAAVESIAQGAEAGDNRLEKALGLLKENNIAEASTLLEAFANDKETKIAKDRKEAAAAYRNLGAIAGLADPKRALAAYEKALALDPDDIESLYRTGYILIDYGDLNKAQTRLERVQELAKATNQVFYQYAAPGALGDIKKRRGDLGGALQSYQSIIPVIESLAKADPGNALWQRDLSVSYNKVGDMRKDQGDLPGALKSYSDSLAIREQLAKSDPGNMEWQRDLSVSYNNVGGVQKDHGDLPGALKSYSDSLAIAERLAKSDPGNAGWQRDLAVAWGMVGIVQEAQGNLPAALKSYQDGLVVFERLAKSDPGNALWQRDLSVSYNKVGDMGKDQGDLSGALKSYSDSLAIAERLAKSDPGNALWQRDLSVSNERLGDIYLAQGNPSSALEQYRASLDRMVPIRDRDPGNADLQRFTAVTMRLIANVCRQQNDKTNARDYMCRGQAIMARLTKLSPDNAVWAKDLAWFDGQIAALDQENIEAPLPGKGKGKAR
jgi:tetratricopeptide (TPR) repeat protein